MPELPEVQTIVNELQTNLPGRKISSCRIIRESIVHGDHNRFQKIVEKKTIIKIDRLGKYIVIHLSTDVWIIVHLRMTGKFVLQPDSRSTHKHDRAVFQLDNRLKLIFSDVRCFGTLEVCDDLGKHKGLRQLGLDPWSKKLTAGILKLKFDARKIPIKTALLDQKIIAGLGNIYASEILFDAGINPMIPANKLSKGKLSAIIQSMRKILSLALKYNGTSISDYRRVDEKQGMFQNFLKVYGKADQKCLNCSCKIEKIVQNQRSTFLCPLCQK
ncbi:MAG: bifunctional DNA-formamidopyrimidine glycosylase/DNA-(apurinic or apyrimidinic site) lyase [Deltaproteobacteria bacterium]|nr:bifunctional DNA-formamidopyrimidine glycosylase/DNA-(apurinic or apyrimidinic site) lyase [Deltaproteobacteria bacterium]